MSNSKLGNEKKNPNLLHNNVNLIFILEVGASFPSEMDGVSPLISKVTVIFTGKLQPQRHMARRYQQRILLKHVLLHSHKFHC